MTRDNRGRFAKATDNNYTNQKGNDTMKNTRPTNKEMRTMALQSAGVNTDNFFNINMSLPVGTNVEIKINGVPYAINSSKDEVVQKIMDNGYVFNRRTDGRFITAQTFKMLHNASLNHKTRTWELGWDAYLRNNYGYMYQFDMMLDEVHKLAKMEKAGDPDFKRLSQFFTKAVVYETCKHYIRQLKKFVKNQPTRKCKGKPYVKLNGYGNIFLADLDRRVYSYLETKLKLIDGAVNYRELETYLNAFMCSVCKLPFETPKCSQWKDAFKGKGAYVTLLNIMKFHGVTVTDYETGEVYDRDKSVVYVESLLDTYKGEYWKFHELLKVTIANNDFDLKKSIAMQSK